MPTTAKFVWTVADATVVLRLASQVANVFDEVYLCQGRNVTKYLRVLLPFKITNDVDVFVSINYYYYCNSDVKIRKYLSDF